MTETYVDSTGETRDKTSGRNTNPPADTPAEAQADPSSAGASALKPQSALAQPDQTEIGKYEAGIATAQKPFLDKLDKTLSNPQERTAQFEKIKDAPNPQDYHKYSMEFASAAAVLGAVAGRWTRQGGTASLNAFAGALKGWQAGNLQAYEEASKQWEQNTKKTIENNNMELEKYHEILNNRKSNIEEMTQGLTIAGSQFQNSVITDLAKSGNFNGVAQAVDKMGQANQRLQGAFGQLSGVRKEQAAEVSSKVDELNGNPELAQRIMQDKPTEWLKIKAAAESLGLKLNDPAKDTQPLPKVSGTPRSLPAMWAQSFTQDFQRQHGRPPSPDELAAGAANFQGGQSAARAAGTRAGQIEVSVAEADQTFQLAVQASDAVPRGKFVPMNKIILGGKQLMSDPAYRQFIDANESAVTAYGATMSRNGANTVAAQSRAHTVLDTADSPQAYRAGIAQLRKEVDAVEKAPGMAKKALLENYFGQASEGAAGGQNTTSTGVTWSVQP
jgi:hypothetical protein